MIKTILVGTDGSNHGQHAVEYAAALAQQLHASVLLVHVASPFPAPIPTAGGYIPYVPQGVVDEMRHDTAEKVTGEFCNPLRDAGVPYETLVLEGAVPELLRDAATDAKVDLIVVGTRALNTLGELFLGSTSHALSHRAPVPVLVVPLPHVAAKSKTQATEEPALAAV